MCALWRSHQRAHLMMSCSHCLVARRLFCDAAMRHSAGTDHTCGRGATARPKAQLAALHLPQHRHGGGVRARFTLPSGTASAAVSQPLALFAPGLHSRMQRVLAATAQAAATREGGHAKPKVVLRFVIRAIRHAPYAFDMDVDGEAEFSDDEGDVV